MVSVVLAEYADWKKNVSECEKLNASWMREEGREGLRSLDTTALLVCSCMVSNIVPSADSVGKAVCTACLLCGTTELCTNSIQVK